MNPRKQIGGRPARSRQLDGRAIRAVSIVLLTWCLGSVLVRAEPRPQDVVSKRAEEDRIRAAGNSALAEDSTPAAGNSALAGDSTLAAEDSTYVLQVVAEEARAGRPEGMYVALKPAAASYVGGDAGRGLAIGPSWTGRLEYQFTRVFGAGVSYQYASDMQVDAADLRMGHLSVSAALPGRRLSPYVQVGMHRNFGASEAPFGVDAGVGLDWKLSSSISVFPEIAFNVVRPETEGIDEGVGGMGSFGIGMRVNLFRQYALSGVRTISGPAKILAGEPARFEVDAVQDAPEPVTYRWNVAGMVLGGPAIEHVFTTPGRFEVLLEAVNRAGTNRSSLYVDVVNDPAALVQDEYVAAFGERPIRIVSIDGPADLTTGELANFRVRVADGAARPIIHRWEMGDGTLSEGNNVSHRYVRPGRYTIVSTARNRRGSDADTLLVTVTDPRRPSDSPDPERPADPVANPRSVPTSERTGRIVSNDSAGTAPAARPDVAGGARGATPRAGSLRGREPINWAQGGYTLLVSSSSSRPAVEAAALQLRRKGYRSGIYLDEAGQGSAIFRVVVGQFASEADAVAARREIVQEGADGAFIIQPLPARGQ